MIILCLLLIFSMGEPIHLTASGTVTEDSCQKRFSMSAYIHNGETRLRLHHPDSGAVNLILAHGNIYDENFAEQKPAAVFAKLVHLGVLDPFLILEILSGNNMELYNSFMAKRADGTIVFSLTPADILMLGETWTDSALLKQILSALEPSVEYVFHIMPDGGLHIDIKLEASVPNLRHVEGVIQIKFPRQHPSSG